MSDAASLPGWQATDADIAAVAKALSHPVRVRMLRLLGRDGGYCGDLAELLGVAQSTVSHHLKALREAGLILGEEEGPATCYRVNLRRLAEARQLLLEGLTVDHPDPTGDKR